MTFEEVVKRLNMECRDEWCIVGSYAVWFHIIRAKNRVGLHKSTWEKIVPGDIDIAISYHAVKQATVSGQVKYRIDFPLAGSQERLGSQRNIQEVEFVYNDISNGLHMRALDQYYSGIRFASIQDCIDKLKLGSAKPAKNEARLIRKDVLEKIKAWSGEFINYEEPAPASAPPSLFSQIAALKKT